MKEPNYQMLKKQSGVIRGIEDTHAPAMVKGEDPENDGKTFVEAILDQQVSSSPVWRKYSKMKNTILSSSLFKQLQGMKGKKNFPSCIIPGICLPLPPVNRKQAYD